MPAFIVGMLFWFRLQRLDPQSSKDDEEARGKSELQADDVKPPEMAGTPVSELPVQSPHEIDGIDVHELSGPLEHELPDSSETETMGYSLGITG